MCQHLDLTLCCRFPLIKPNLWHEKESKDFSNDRCHFWCIGTNHSREAGLIVSVVTLHCQHSSRVLSEERYGWLHYNSRLLAGVVDFITQLDAWKQNLVCVHFIHGVLHDKGQSQSVIVHAVKNRKRWFSSASVEVWYLLRTISLPLAADVVRHRPLGEVAGELVDGKQSP